MKRLVLNRPRESATTFEQLMGRGIKTLEIVPESRPCRVCHQDFEAHWLLQWVCPNCAATQKATSEGYQRAEEQARQRRRLEAVGLTGRLVDMTFATFDPSIQPEAYKAAFDFADQFPFYRSLALVGNSGTGKTHLGAAVVRKLFEDGEEGRYVHLPSLSSELRMAHDWQEAAQRLVHPLYTAPVVVLDDVGREKPAPSFPELLDVLIDRRWVGGYPTILTANMSRAELFGSGKAGSGWLSQAASSRFGSEAVVVQTRDGDRRYQRQGR